MYIFCNNNHKIPLSKPCFGLVFRMVAMVVTVSFISSLVILPTNASAQRITVIPSSVGGMGLNLPVPGTMVNPTPSFIPAVIKGVRIFPNNPLRFDFIIDVGESGLEGESLKEESQKLIKYFLASLTVPEEDMWVNLSPYESDRIIPNAFGVTEMGRDLLAQDYLLKQLTASFIYPEEDLGAEFWDRVYEKSQEMYGTKDIPVDTFNKVWIVPQKAVVYENGDTAFVVESRLKVMLEDDYLAMSVGTGLDPVRNKFANNRTAARAVPTEIIQEIIIPEIEKEVNEGKNFALLRQIYHSMILATWFKRNLRESVLGRIYVGKNKVEGVDVEDKEVKQKIYQQYLDAFKVGVYNYIKEDYDPTTQQIIPRKYFSGGVWFEEVDRAMLVVHGDQHAKDLAMTSKQPMQKISAYLEGVKNSAKVHIAAPILLENVNKKMDTMYEITWQGAPNSVFVNVSDQVAVVFVGKLGSILLSENGRSKATLFRLGGYCAGVVENSGGILIKFNKEKKVFVVEDQGKRKDDMFEVKKFDKKKNFSEYTYQFDDIKFVENSNSTEIKNPSANKFLNGENFKKLQKSNSQEHRRRSADLILAFRALNRSKGANENEITQVIEAWIQTFSNEPRELRSLVDFVRKENLYSKEWTAARKILETKISNSALLQNKDNAQKDDVTPGGIDFNPSQLNIETRGQGIDFNAPIDPQMLENLERVPVDGFTPFIFQITPVTNFPLLLGIEESDEESMDISWRWKY